MDALRGSRCLIKASASDCFLRHLGTLCYATRSISPLARAHINSHSAALSHANSWILRVHVVLPIVVRLAGPPSRLLILVDASASVGRRLGARSCVAGATCTIWACDRGAGILLLRYRLALVTFFVIRSVACYHVTFIVKIRMSRYGSSGSIDTSSLVRNWSSFLWIGGCARHGIRRLFVTLSNRSFHVCFQFKFQ